MNNAIEDFSNISVGDIIWAKRYGDETEKKNIKKGHEKSPFVIIKKTKYRIYALMCTTNPHTNIKWNKLFYMLNRLTYNFKKNCYVNTGYVYLIDKNKYIRTIGHLNNEDQNNLNKYLHIVKNSTLGNRLNINLRGIDFNIGKGDIIVFDNKKYLIYDINNGKYKCYSLNKKKPQRNVILINNTYYAIGIYKEEISTRRKVLLLDTLNDSELEMVLSILDKRKQDEDVVDTIGVGSLVDYKNNYYYLYKEEDNCYRSFRTFISDDHNVNMTILVINGGIYYTYFNTIILKKDSDFKLRRNATLKEIKRNEMVHNSSKYQRRKENIKIKREMHFKDNDNTDIDKFLPRVIINDRVNGENYLILSRNNNVIELVNINDFSDYFYYELMDNDTRYNIFKVISNEEYNGYYDKVKYFKQLAMSLNTN